MEMKTCDGRDEIVTLFFKGIGMTLGILIFYLIIVKHKLKKAILPFIKSHMLAHMISL